MSRTTNPGLLSKNFAGQVFGAFAQDLVKYIEGGLTKEQCDANKLWLDEFSAAAAGFPDGKLIGRKIFQRCDAVTREYVQWNDGPENSAPEGVVRRKKYHARIKKKVNLLSGTYRKRAALLEREADINVYNSFYTATENLVNAVPGMLARVAGTLGKYPPPT